LVTVDETKEERPMRATTTTLIAAAWITACLLPNPATAKPSPAQKCASAKQQAVGKSTGCQLKCTAKAALKGLPANDPALLACLSSCRAKFVATFAKLEAKGGCDPAGNAVPVQAKVDACAIDLADDLQPGGRSPSCTVPFRADARDVVDGFAYGLDAAGNLDVPASCGGSPSVCCTGGNPVAPCGPLHFDFALRDGETGPSISPAGGPNFFAMDIPMRLQTVADLPITIPLIGDCGMHIDTAPGADPRVHVSFQVQFSADRLRMGPTSNVTLVGLTSDDVSVTGGIGCQLASLGLNFFVGTLTDTLADTLFTRFDHLCRRCCTGDIAQCAP
jgi:hypothetical protein